MKNKKLLYTAVSIFSVIVVLAVFLIIWYWADSYEDFNSKIFDTEFDIPDLESGAAPQGITAYYTGDFTVKAKKNEDGTTDADATYRKDNYFFISAYMPKGPSRVYVVGQAQGLIGYVTLLNDDGTEHTGHVGGVAINRDNLWVSSDKVDKDGVKTGVVYVAQVSSSYTYLYQEVIDKAAKSKTGGDNTVKFTAYFHAQGANDFLYYYNANNYGGTTTPSTNDRLYTGQFARRGDKAYEERSLTTPTVETRDAYGELTGKKTGGDKNNAFVYEYRVAATYTNTEYKTGLYYLTGSDTNNGKAVTSDSGYQVPKIEAIYSVPDDIQGFARTNDGKLILSQSYALKNSRLYYYDWEKFYNTATVKFEGNNVKLVDNKKLYSSDAVAGEQFKYEGVWNTLSTGQKGVQYSAKNSLYVYFADSSSLVRSFDIPSMSEGLCVMKDAEGEQRVYVLFESGAKKYRTFVRRILINVYSFVPEKNY